jgi:hypothetical protein
MEHDRCYDANYLDCKCDYNLMTAVNKAMTELPQLKGTAELIKGWFDSSPCSCSDGTTRAPLNGKISYKMKKKCK